MTYVYHHPGERFGALTAVRHVENVDANGGSYRKRIWEFQCECGNTLLADIGLIKQRKHASCGCVQLTWDKIGRTPLPTGEASFNHLYASYKRGAKGRELEFAISKEEFRNLTSQSCYYCDLPPSRTHLAGKGVNGYYTFTGLDRMDNSLGYVLDNLVPCCRICNYAKRNVPYEEFVAWLGRLKTQWHLTTSVSRSDEVRRH